MGEVVKSYNWLGEIQRCFFLSINDIKLTFSSLCMYLKSLVQGAETPTYFVQLSMRVGKWPEDGIQPERVESRINRLLKIVNIQRCKNIDSNNHTASRLRVQSIEQSPENPNIALAVLEAEVHASLFLAKCDVDLNRANHKQGDKQTKMTKFCNGICLFLVLIGVIWAPMLMYSSGNPTNIANPIKDASVRMDIKTVSGRLTLYESTLCELLSGEELDVRANLDPHGYLKTYDESDVQLICCQADGSSRDRPKEKEVVKYEIVVQDRDLPKAAGVVDVLYGVSNSFAVYDIYPRYFRVTGSGDVRLLEEAVELVSANVTLHRGSPGWWSFEDINPLGVQGFGGPAGPVAIIVSEETPHKFWNSKVFLVKRLAISASGVSTLLLFSLLDDLSDFSVPI